jgi:hypothetical protein
MGLALSNFDTSMLPRVGYAFLLGLAIIITAAVLLKVWNIAEYHLKKFLRKHMK